MTGARGSRPHRVLAVGECLLELRHHSATDLSLGFAGDTYETAVHLRRTGEALGEELRVGFVTGLGDDVYSEQMRREWSLEGIEDLSRTVPGRTPGLYAVHRDADGGQAVQFWRYASAAAVLFQGCEWVTSLTGDLVHFSGLTLQLMSRPARAAFLTTVDRLRDTGTLVSFDTRFRPDGWSDITVARTAFHDAAGRSDVVLARLSDERVLFPDTDEDEAVERYLALGAREVVLTRGDGGSVAVEIGGARTHVPVSDSGPGSDGARTRPAFIGAYLAGRLAGLRPPDSVSLGADVAGSTHRSRTMASPP